MENQEAKAFQLLNLIELHEECQEFLSPVDYKRLGIPMYPIIIKNPMDIGTIKKRLKAHYYTNIHDFIADIQLVWDNCKKYNEASTEIHQQAVFLEKQTRRHCSKLRLPLPHTNKNIGNDDGVLEDFKNLTFEEKWRMTEAVRKLNQNALEKIVKVVKEKCPESVETMETDKIKIKLDSITREAFNLLQEIIEEYTSENLPQKRPKNE
ncbi:hypothetical protein SteCoe_22617 [Stentor coeruleus]|uniref:Bromo domain-containing protein n=1 Tax=Stentor coeruleus TaxID=5963 RepID=A0A1R2BLV8_9CILI|nr:hypothetical protein SteCoe_22617 [Stentor coeruleus]